MKQVDFGAAMKPQNKAKTKYLTPAHPYDLDPIKDKILVYTKQIDKMFETADLHKVSDEQSLVKAVQMGTSAKDLWKKIEEVRKRETQEPNEFVKSVNSFAKIFQERLKNIENMIKRKVGDYNYHKELERREQERKAREEAERLQAQLDKEAKEKGVESVKVGEPVMPEPEKVTRTETGASHQRLHWTFEIVNADKVPREYLVPDEKKIRQAVGMGIREIPGVKIYEKASTVFRT